MVQNCCALCMGGIGKFVCYLLCCKCCCRCCCCKKKQKEPAVEMVYSSRPRNDYNNTDDDSVYNESSTYSESIIKRRPYTGNATTGIYMSESSLYSGSITELKNELKLEFACEVKGTVEIGGTHQPIKGVLRMESDDSKKRQLPDKPSIYAVNPGISHKINLHHDNSRMELFNQQDIFKKAPKPLPRTQETENIRNSEIYFSEEDENSVYDEEAHIPDNYDTPKPPFPLPALPNRMAKDPKELYVPVYENLDWKASNTKTMDTETDEDSSQNKTPGPELPARNFSRTTDDNNDENIYEDIDLGYRGAYSKKELNVDASEQRVDYEIYM